MQAAKMEGSRLKEFGVEQKVFFDALRNYANSRVMFSWNVLSGIDIGVYAISPFTFDEVREISAKEAAEVNRHGQRLLEIASVMTRDEKFEVVLGCGPKSLKKTYGISIPESAIDMETDDREAIVARESARRGFWFAKLAVPSRHILHNEHNLQLAEETFDSDVIPYVVNTMAELYVDPKPLTCTVRSS